MATWPDDQDVEAFIGSLTDEDKTVLDQILLASIAYLTYRCDVEVDDYDMPVVSDNLHHACLLLVHREFKRRQSPEGVAAWGELGAVRISRIDPDIEAMLLPDRSWGIA